MEHSAHRRPRTLHHVRAGVDSYLQVVRRKLLSGPIVLPKGFKGMSIKADLVPLIAPRMENTEEFRGICLY